MSKKALLFLMVFVLVVSCLFANTNPEAISPGNELKTSIVNQICPTFSWTQVPGAKAYQIAVFEMSERYEGLSYYEEQVALSQPVLIKKISGTASSWTPSLEEALQNEVRYVWFVQAVDPYGNSTWSVGKKFVVRDSIGLTEIKEKVKKQLAARGIEADLVDEAFEGIQSQNIKTKEGGKLKGKIQPEKKRQIKGIKQENREIKRKENRTLEIEVDSTVGALGSEGYGTGNVYYGLYSGASLTTNAEYNTFFGGGAGYSTDSGDSNTFVGNSSGYSNTGGIYNTFIGTAAGFNCSTGTRNTFLGDSAGYLNTTASYNTFVGTSAGANNTGENNTCLGYRSGYKNNTGSCNTFLGYAAGYSNTTGNHNTFIGEYAGYSNTTGHGNVCLGRNAGFLETGSHKLYIEDSSPSSPLIYGEFDNDLVTINGTLNVTDSNINVDTTSTRARFKLQADGGGVNQDDYFNFTMRNDYGDVTLSIRDSSASVWLPLLSYEYLNNKVDFKDNDIVTTGTISSGGGAYTSGGAWIEASSRDYKENIMELNQDESIQALQSLNPVRYNYKNNKEEEFLGFIAEDVPDLVAMNGRRGMHVMDIVAVLTKVAQEQQKTIESLKKEVRNLKEKIRDNSDQ